MDKPRFLFSKRGVPFVLLLISLITFGLLIPQLGFYWDDWSKILVPRLWGLNAYFDYYAEDRPLSSWTHIVLTPLLGLRPIGWHAAALLFRWLSAWGMCWSLDGLWPNARRQNLAASALFLVYPVFKQQAAAVTFHQQWLQYALFFLSLGAMIYAYRPAYRFVDNTARPDRRRFWALTALSMAAMLLQLSVTEYFAPLELVRPVVLWILLSQACSPEGGRRFAARRALETARRWAPYLVPLAMYVVWRLFLIQLPGEDPYRANTLYAFLQAPLQTAGQMAQVVFIDTARVFFGSWFDTFNIHLVGVPPFTLVSYLVGLAVGVGLAVYLVRFPRTEPDAGDSDEGKRESQWMRQALLLGLAAAMLGPVPAWITGRQVVFDFHSDRYAMPAMFGAALLCVVGIEWLSQRRLQRALLVGLLVSVAAGMHLRVANDYRWIWTDETRLFWQLSWRAPSIKPSTALFFEEEPFPNQGLFSTSAALNLLYPQPEEALTGDSPLAYWVYTLRPRYEHEVPESLENIGVATQFRTLRFEGKTPDSLLLYHNPAYGSCLWVLSERDRSHPYLPDLVKDFLPISNLSRIEDAPAAAGYPPVEFFGPEPAHTWCFYYEKGALAWQQQNWDEVVRLGDEARQQGYYPVHSGSDSPYEWLPFIEGYARAGRWSDAEELTAAAFQRDSAYGPMLCELWQETLAPLPGGEKPLAAARQALGCQP